MLEHTHFSCNIFAVIAFCQSCTTASALHRYASGKSAVSGGGKQCGFAKSGITGNDIAFRINFRDAFSQIKPSAQTP